MAIEAKVKSSSLMPIKSSHALIEVEIKATAGEAVSQTVSLGRVYKSVKVLSAATTFSKMPTANYSPAVAVADNSSVVIVAAAVDEQPLIHVVTLECEV